MKPHYLLLKKVFTNLRSLELNLVRIGSWLKAVSQNMSHILFYSQNDPHGYIEVKK